MQNLNFTDWDRAMGSSEGCLDVVSELENALSLYQEELSLCQKRLVAEQITTKTLRESNQRLRDLLKEYENDNH